MAKQSGVFKVRGKIEGRSYYKPKYTKEYLSRSINQQMSERVKTEEGFANTRAYAAEFGASANMANSILDALIERQLLLKKAYRPALLNKCLLEQLSFDDYHVIGQRGWANTAWQENVRSFVAGLAKSTPDNYFNTSLRFYAHDTTIGGLDAWKVRVMCSNINFSDSVLRSLGVDKVRMEFFLASVFAPYYDANYAKYTYAVMDSQIVGSYEHEVGEEYDEELASTTMRALGSRKDEKGTMVMPFCVFRCYRRIGSTDVELFSRDTFGIFPIEDDSPTIPSYEYNGEEYQPTTSAPEIEVGIANSIKVNLQNVTMQSTDQVTMKVNGSYCSINIKTASFIIATLPQSLDGELLSSIMVTINTQTITFERVTPRPR